RADGTLQKLIKENITELAGDDPVAATIPKIDGAETLKIAVTGDMPALDCILANNTPAGFNVAFLSELSKRINKNFEIVSIEAGARGAALSSGQVDILFWVMGTYDQDGKALPYPLDDMKGVAISIPYMMDSRVGVALK
ncbi:MAG: transporter substrate-binding domain-containing protein, partial [Selenomonadaceae bacterium]|nr:transporter substrate-binding domain-containing protein [Selenomonadaceae bacterium]